MESIFEYLGLNLVALVWHSANFLLLLAALWWLFFRPMTRLLEERQRRVRESLVRAEEIERRHAAAESERGALLAAAHAQAREIRARADEQARELLVRARLQARDEADRILRRAASTAAEREAGPGARNGRVRSALATATK